MRNWIRLAALPLMFLVGLVLVQAPIASEGDRDEGTARLVDFRMAPLEQVKKINRHVRDREGAVETLTVMTWDGQGDGRHLIVDPARTSSAEIRERLTDRRFDSVSWHRRPSRPMGTCDSDQECQEKVEQMCKDAGHDGVDDETVQVTTHVDGSKTCSGDCDSNGAVAFVTCNSR